MRYILKTILIFLFCFSLNADAQLAKWVLGGSQQLANGTFNSLAPGNLKFFNVDFTGANPVVTQRTLGASINSIVSYGSEDVVNCALDTSKKILFYLFCAALIPTSSGSSNAIDTIYFAAPDINNVDQVFGKVACQANGSSVIEHGLCPRPGTNDQYYFVWKGKALSNTSDDVKYCIVNITSKTVSAPITIISNESNGEGMAISGLNCTGNNRWLYTSEIISGGNVTIRRSEINNAGIGNTSDIYTINIPGNGACVVQGGIEISNASDKLAICNYNTNVAKDAILFDLNLSTGLLTNERSYDNPNYPLVNCEFSPDGTRLYLLQSGSSSFPNIVYNTPAIATGTLVLNASYQMTSIAPLKGCLQLEKAFDGKIYVNPGQNRDSLFTVPTPNTAALTMGYTTGNIFLGVTRLGTGFPDQVDGERYWTMAPLSSSLSSTASTCGSSNGSAQVSASGGSSFFTYSWSSGQTTSGITGLSAGSYTVTVSSNTCVNVHTVTIVQSGPNVSLNTTNISCNSTTGSSTASVSGGTSPYTYSWSGGQTSQTATGLTAGSYTLTVTDNTGCTKTVSVSVTAASVPALTLSSSTNVLCNGAQTGSATMSASSGTAPYTYTWSSGGGTNSSATGLGAGLYTLTVTDANGCTSTQTVMITQPAAISIGVSSVSTTCGTSNGSASSTVSGGSGSLSYSWNPGGKTTSTITGLASGTYSLTVTDGFGCTKTASVFIGTLNGPVLSVTSSASTTCNGSANGSTSVSTSGGYGAYTYSWNNGQTGASATGLSAGVYTITVTDSIGCQAMQTIGITQPAAVGATISSTNTNCNAFTGTASASSTGGTGSYTYAWSNGQSTQSVTGLSAGTYTVLITDANGCTGTSSVTVNQFTGPTANAGANVTITAGSSTILNATGGTSYSWSPSNGLSCTNCQSPIASPTVNTTYTVVVTDNNGCTATAQVTVFVDTPCLSGEIFVPNVFSPNGDGKNDVLYVYGTCYKYFQLLVFDRWGEKVFETSDPAIGWDGRFQGEPFTTAVFVYHLKAQLLNDKEIDQKGNITLIR